MKYQNVVTGEEYEEEFDFVIVSTGHHSKPNMPNIPKEEIFKGKLKTYIPLLTYLAKRFSTNYM